VKITRQIIVLDAADIATVSNFWAGVFGGRALASDPDWHDVLDAEGEWRIGVQLAPEHTPPLWPNGAAQQIHLDLHVEDPHEAEREVIALGARLLKRSDNPDGESGFHVYADPAGHPFCICWGH
jgi:predicted enzyme related to lactoylglutathione lyase